MEQMEFNERFHFEITWNFPLTIDIFSLHFSLTLSIFFRDSFSIFD